jgi:hypothetical protein
LQKGKQLSARSQTFKTRTKNHLSSSSLKKILVKERNKQMQHEISESK